MVFRRVHVERLRMFGLLGRRGLLLLMFGLLWMSFGFGVLTVEQLRFTSEPARAPLLSVLDHQQIGWVWIATGVVSLIAGLTRTRHGRSDILGFNALIVPAAVWFLGYVWSYLAWLMDGSGRASAWVAAIVWLIVVVFVLLVAGWPDPDDPAFRDPKGEHG